MERCVHRLCWHKSACRHPWLCMRASSAAGTYSDQPSQDTSTYDKHARASLSWAPRTLMCHSTPILSADSWPHRSTKLPAGLRAHPPDDGGAQGLARVRAHVRVGALQGAETQVGSGGGARELLGEVGERPGARADAQLQEEQHAQEVVARPPLEQAPHKDVARAWHQTQVGSCWPS